MTFRLEAACGHLKDVLKPTMMLDECVDTLQFLQSIAELEYANNMMDVGFMRYAGADTELHKLSKVVSQHAYELDARKTQYTTQQTQPHMIEMVLTVDTNLKYHLDTRVRSLKCWCVTNNASDLTKLTVSYLYRHIIVHLHS
jgi:hypothetical protein